MTIQQQIRQAFLASPSLTSATSADGETIRIQLKQRDDNGIAHLSVTSSVPINDDIVIDGIGYRVLYATMVSSCLYHYNLIKKGNSHGSAQRPETRSKFFRSN